MKCTLFTFLLCLFILVSCTGNKQDEKISLISKYDDNVLLHAKTNIDSAYYYANEMKRLSEEMNYEIGRIRSLICFGIICIYQYNDTCTLDFLNKAIKKSKSINYKEGLARAKLNMGFFYFYNENYKKALPCFLESLKIFEDIKNNERVIFSLINIGGAYVGLNKMDSSLYYSLVCRSVPTMQYAPGLAYWLFAYVKLNHRTSRPDNVRQHFVVIEK